MTDEHLQSRSLAIEKEKAERLKSRKEYDDKKAALEGFHCKTDGRKTVGKKIRLRMN